MTIKRFLTVIVALVFIAVGNVDAQLSYGLRGGLNMTNVWGDFGETKLKPGFQVGGVADYALNDDFSIQPGLLFSVQGYKMEFESVVTNSNFYYVQVPINAQYKLELNGMKLLLQAGPYLGYAISGKENTKIDGEKFGGTIEFGSGDDQLNALDFGIGAGIGLQFGKIQTSIGYNLGFANLTNISELQMKNNGMALTITYMFGM